MLGARVFAVWNPVKTEGFDSGCCITPPMGTAEHHPGQLRSGYAEPAAALLSGRGGNVLLRLRVS